jgi:hypothetical protein
MQALIAAKVTTIGGGSLQWQSNRCNDGDVVDINCGAVGAMPELCKK